MKGCAIPRFSFYCVAQPGQEALSLGSRLGYLLSFLQGVHRGQSRLSEVQCNYFRRGHRRPVRRHRVSQLSHSARGQLVRPDARGVGWAWLEAFVAWSITRGGPGPLGASLPLLYAVLAFGVVSALTTMLTGDVLVAPELPPAAAPAAGHGHDAHGHAPSHGGGHH